ncbi:hypothetical protein apy_09060 [Aeropyrum pernix]|uniref:Uncharacterized protein n=1 Tax=Aeropyrum pernix TaxID=56636 RepID=A0A401H9R1_AERPX|nr:hypothetical protein apy_09060 [Aeropyrum pernix]
MIVGILSRIAPFLILLAVIAAPPALAGYQGDLGSYNGQIAGPSGNFYYSVGVGMTAGEPSPTLNNNLLVSGTVAYSINDPYDSFTVSFTRNHKVSVESGVFGYEHEPSIAVDPGNPDNVVVASHHEGLAGLPNAIGVYYSMDGGATWAGPLVMPLAQEGDIYHSDPALASTGDGVFYLAYMSIGPRETPGGYYLSASIVVAKSVDGGATWSIIHVIEPNYLIDEMNQSGIIPFSVMLDKPYISAARVGGSDVVVVTYTAIADGYDTINRLSTTILRITAVVSPDGGSTWIGPSTVAEAVNTSEGMRFGGGIQVLQGSNPAVSPDGSIYVAYYDSLSDGYLEGKAAIMVSVSQDFGQTWSKPEQAAVIGREMDYYSPSGFRMAASMFPSIDVSPDGTIYVAYASAGQDDPGDVFLVYKTPESQVWEEPLMISRGEGSLQFFPWLDVDESGRVHVIWGDTMNDPSHMSYHVIYATFDPASGSIEYGQVTDYASFALGVFFIGDYFNVAASQGQVYAVWTDARMSIKKVGSLIYIGGDTSIFYAKLGERPQPRLIIAPEELEAGRAAIASIQLEDFPSYGVYMLSIEGVPLTGIDSLIFTDELGRAVQKTILPPLASGSYSLQLVAFSDSSIHAEKDVTYIDVVLGAVDASKQEILESVRETAMSTGSALESLETRMASLEEIARQNSQDIGEIKGSLDDVSASVDTLSSRLGDIEASINSKIDTASEDIKNEVRSEGEKTRSTVNSMLGEIESLINEKTSGIMGAIEELGTSIQKGVEEAKGDAETAISRGNMAIGLSVLALLAGLGGVVLAFRKA